LSEAANLAKLIEQRADVDSVQLISADEALREFKLQSGFGEALDHLSRNPLPHTLVVRPGAQNTAASMVLLREELDNLPETELVQVDTDWVLRFHAILDIVRQAIFIGSILLGAAIVVIIGNTIRLDIQNRREEIEVTKLIGASNGFVRRPFLWTGLWYGLLGGALAIGLVLYGIFLLEAPIARLAGLYHGDIALLNFDLREVATILGIGVGLGLVGSWFAVARHLRRIEPR
jgi:cell division transport system permease protein